MLRQYTVQREKQALLREYAAVVVASGHMAQEYRNQGVEARVLPLPVTAPELPAARSATRYSLLFLGRLERSKGVEIAIESVARAADSVERPVRLVVAGTGSLDAALARRAAEVTRERPRLTIEFPGWLTDSGRAAALSEADLLLVPSVWPEPFGLAGVEAGLGGVPSIAFGVGGVCDWLKDGVSGRVVPFAGDHLDRFTAAIVGTLRDPAALEAMRAPAQRIARTFPMAAHLDRLEEVLGTVVASRRSHHEPQPV